jgi:hypothetical protein
MVIFNQIPEIGVFVGVGCGQIRKLDRIHQIRKLIKAEAIPQPLIVAVGVGGIHNLTIDEKDKPRSIQGVMTGPIAASGRCWTIGLDEQFTRSLSEGDQLQNTADINFV